LEENREKQREPLLRLWDRFNTPEFLAINFPNVQDNQIDVPEKTTLDGLSSLQPFGAALELRFVPLCKLPNMRVETLRIIDALPDSVWQVEAVDSETHEGTPMFRFQLTESGLEMDWQPEGLNNQYLYDTILSSLGFLRLNVAGSPETEKWISLFVPIKTKPMRVSDLAGLFGTETPELAVDLPFASELWRRIFSEMQDPPTLLLEVRAEPGDRWVVEPASSSSVFHARFRTSQEVKKPTESGGDIFETIEIPFVAEASPEKVVWKGSEYVRRLHSEQESTKSSKEKLTQEIGQLQNKMFGAGRNEADAKKLDGYKAELRSCELRLKEIENILEKLPAAYKEISQNESARLHYLVFLESADEDRKLLILKTAPKHSVGF
jgi:hypothetical protein